MAGGEGKAAVPLLEKKPEVYFHGCPGCAMDRRKAENPGIPYVLFFHMWVINLVTCSSILLYQTFIYPHIIQVLGLINTSRVAAPQDQRATANGIATTLMSFSKTFAPAGAGIMFSWAQKHQHAFLIPGDQILFFLLAMVVFLEFIWTFKPFLAMAKESSSGSCH
ncbi:protein ZINC INDUCED FACILITATOR-LIKE 1-like isoform X2 [Panicum miliaceum]|uniref:Protein ZINC INDUCED FACILITATOR-LIKE 1-like isoform X2 n=1 Tax=Panicum miliaceum TaxID=4540 RepID=A0A3L6T327_PANMI|nr:protein ZINC INDUCED FACILITATOR-LIKE 1-like isoform X2 [Panicum miliaceum]